MSCPREDLEPYHVQALSESETRAVEEHLRGCAVCRAALECVARIEEQLGRFPEADPRLSRVRRFVFAWYAAAVLLLAAGVAFVLTRPEPPGTPALIPLQDAAVEETVRRLGDGDIRVREAATESLVERWESDEVARSLERLLTSDPEIRERAMRVLDRVSFRRALGKKHVERLGSRRVDELMAGDEWMTLLNALDPEFVLRRVQVLEDPASMYRFLEAVCKEKIGGTAAAVAVLLESDRRHRIEAGQRSYSLRIAELAAETLAELQASQTAPQVAKLLESSDPELRATGVRTLGRLRAADLAPRIAERLKDSDGWVRGSAALALAELGARDYLGRILDLLKDPEEASRSHKDTPLPLAVFPVRYHALQAIRQMGARDRQEEVAACAEDSNVYVRRAAAVALGEARAEEHARVLVRLLKDPDYEVRGCAIEALWRLKDRHEPEIWKLLADENPNLKIRVIDLVIEADAKDQLPAIAGLLSDREGFVRARAIVAMGRFGAKQYADRIKSLLGDKAEGFRDEKYNARPVSEAAERVLGEWGFLNVPLPPEQDELGPVSEADYIFVGSRPDERGEAVGQFFRYRHHWEWSGVNCLKGPEEATIVHIQGDYEDELAARPKLPAGKTIVFLKGKGSVEGKTATFEATLDRTRVLAVLPWTADLEKKIAGAVEVARDRARRTERVEFAEKLVAQVQAHVEAGAASKEELSDARRELYKARCRAGLLEAKEYYTLARELAAAKVESRTRLFEAGLVLRFEVTLASVELAYLDLRLGKIQERELEELRSKASEELAARVKLGLLNEKARQALLSRILKDPDEDLGK